MIVVVADTSPPNYLIQIACEHILAALYEQILVPKAVFEELTHPGAPEEVRTWLRDIPGWCVIREMQAVADPTLSRLDPGEREAIQLAREERADLLLMDEKLGVRTARRRGLSVIGTLGVLVVAAQGDLLDMESALARLQATDFRCTPQLFQQASQRARKKGWKA